MAISIDLPKTSTCKVTNAGLFWKSLAKASNKIECHQERVKFEGGIDLGEVVIGRFADSRAKVLRSGGNFSNRAMFSCSVHCNPTLTEGKERIDPLGSGGLYTHIGAYFDPELAKGFIVYNARPVSLLGLDIDANGDLEPKVYHVIKEDRGDLTDYEIYTQPQQKTEINGEVKQYPQTVLNNGAKYLYFIMQQKGIKGISVTDR